MEPTVLSFLLAGLGGGLVMALLIVRAQRALPTRRTGTTNSVAPDSRPVINIATIRVAGVGGLGLVVVAVAFALEYARIGQTVTIGAALGLVLATALILWRHRAGPMPSTGRSRGANTTLSIDQPLKSTDKADAPPPARKLRSEVSEKRAC